MMFLYSLISVYLIGLLVFATSADFGTPKWDNAFFMWQAIAETGFLTWGVIYSVGNKFVKNKVKWLLVFSGMKFLWEIVSLLTSIAINNDVVVMVCFCLLVVITSFLTFWQKNKANVWLSRQLNI